MKVALVSSHPAFPATEGNRSRIQQLARAVLELGHEVTFILLPFAHRVVDHAAHEQLFGKDRYIRITDRQPRGAAPQGRNWPGKWTLLQIRGGLERAGHRMETRPSGRWLLRQLVRGGYAARRLLGGESAYYSELDALRDPDWAEQIASAGRDMDAVIVEYVFHSWAFDSFPPETLRVLDTHDAFANRHRSYLARGVGDYWTSLRPQAENAGLRRADVVIAIQPGEADCFGRQLARDAGGADPDVTVISHLMRQPPAALQSSVQEAALFLASDNSANRHALDQWIRRVLPRVLDAMPGFRLKLAGSICGWAPDHPRVTKLGWVQDLHAALEEAPLAVNPLLVGTGINIKLLESMAAGLPTVSTETGVRGLPTSFRNGVMVVPDSDPAAFAAAVVRLAKDPALRSRLGGAAFEDARRWNAEQKSVLAACLSRQPRTRPPTHEASRGSFATDGASA